MPRRLALLVLLVSAPLLSGCLVVRTVNAAAGAAGDVAQGAVDLVTPGGDDKRRAEDGKRQSETADS